LEEKQSKYNGHLVVSRSWGFGTYIQANGLTQSGGIVESIWKSTLRKIRNYLPSEEGKFQIHNILILGLGGGTVAKLIQKNWKETKITGVDIDPTIVELGKKYLGLDRNNVDIIIGDAYKKSEELKSKNEKFDLIVVDLYNGDKFPKKFESDNFLSFVRGGLAKQGLIVFNRLYYKDKKIEAEGFGEKLQKYFGKVESFRPVSNIMFICNI
jgi:spermidine synthase